MSKANEADRSSHKAIRQERIKTSIQAYAQRNIFVALKEGVFMFQKMILASNLSPLANQSGSPQICNLWGERRQPSPNDVSVILCDRLAERERPNSSSHYTIRSSWTG